MENTITIADKQQSPVHLMALNSEQMTAANSHLIDFFTAKISECSAQAAELLAATDEAKKHKWKYSTLAAQHRRELNRVTFYLKCLEAVKAGFTIEPNIPIDVFAIRVKRDKPVAELVTSSWRNPTVADEKPQILPSEVGRYESPVQIVSNDVNTVMKDGKETKVYQQWPTDFQAIEFPLIAAMPEVMNATQQAMAKLIFDQIGVSPQNTRKGDPLIIGQILGHKIGSQRQTVSFLIAWHLDLRTL